MCAVLPNQVTTHDFLIIGLEKPRNNGASPFPQLENGLRV